MSGYQWIMSQISDEHRAIIERRARLAGLFSEAYSQKKFMADTAGFRMTMSRQGFINKSIAALRLPDVVVTSRRSAHGTNHSVRLMGQNARYQQEYETAKRSGVRMQSTLLEYVNSRRKSDGLPMITEKEMTAARSGTRFRMQAGNGPEILVFGDIAADSAMNAEKFVGQLGQLADSPEITIRINSDGGDPYQALAMYNSLRSCPAQIRTVNEGMAASAASLLFMAGDIREMRPGSQLMIHEPEVGFSGRADELRRIASAIDKTRHSVAQIYASRSGKPVASILQMMKDETYFSADEAVRAGFATAAA
ncbi:MAG TPA: head maturation protease, ClpP-related [Planctomicrobium sp.]|nr:head maturation protease, ClpP-related [Planctomicrobium sp.]